MQSALEKTRRDKIIGSSLEAKVVLHLTEADYLWVKDYETDLPAIFIVSCVEVKLASTPSSTKEGNDTVPGLKEIEVRKAEGAKCDRCWNIRQDVGLQAQHPTLCGRCVEALG